MTRPKAALWDLDGVLVDSAPCHFEAFRRLMAEQGREFTEDDFQRTFGMRNDAILQILLGSLPSAKVEEMSARKEELFRDLIRFRVEALPGACELVHRLSEAGVPQAIVSSAPRANVDLILGALGLEDSFAVVVSGEDVVKGKPDPEGYLAAASRLGASPGRCIVLEDAPEGVAAAKAAGMKCIGVATSRALGRLAQADLVVGGLADPAVAACFAEG